MAVTTTHVNAAPEAVFDILHDGWRYAQWVVGTKAVRDVDATFPEPGAKLHYTAGIGPLTLNDTTKVLSIDEHGHEIALEARGKLAGSAFIRLRVEPEDGGSRVTIDEKPLKGLAATLHNPLSDLSVKVRNVFTLRRLGRLAEQGARAGRAGRAD